MSVNCAMRRIIVRSIWLCCVLVHRKVPRIARSNAPTRTENATGSRWVVSGAMLIDRERSTIDTSKRECAAASVSASRERYVAIFFPLFTLGRVDYFGDSFVRSVVQLRRQPTPAPTR